MIMCRLGKIEVYNLQFGHNHVSSGKSHATYPQRMAQSSQTDGRIGGFCCGQLVALMEEWRLESTF
jgi:hypothetical protein